MIRLFLLALSVAGVVDLTDGWRYAATAPHAAPPSAQGAWRDSVDDVPQDGDVWYRVPLPRLPAEPRLVFRAYAGTFEVFVDQTRVYAHEEPSASGHLRLHVVTLPADHALHNLYFRFPPRQPQPLLGGVPAVTTASAVPRALMHVSTDALRGGVGDDIAAAILIVSGVLSVVVSRLRRRANGGALLWFGVFALLYGVRLLAGSDLLMLLGLSPRRMAFVDAWITSIIPIPGWMLARKLIGDGWKSTLRWQVWAFAVFAPVAIAADVIRDEPGSLESVNSALVVFGGVMIIGNLILLGHQRRTRELRVLAAGSSIFLMLALLNNLAALRILPLQPLNETIGLLFFVAALNYAAVRQFVRGEQERVALEGELATAREIQLSILPREMPQVSGLQFAARYDPASSVAGDLYDFVAIDPTHAGVVVADVAGHGVPAALIASMVKVAVSSQTRLANDPATLLREINATLMRDVRRNFVTATFLWFDMEQRTVTVSNAGHAPPVIIRDNATIELGPHGVLLGRFANATYGAETIAIQPGDRVVAWTDGIIEARNRRGEQFTEERLYAMLKRGASADAVVDAVHVWSEGGDIADADDLTIVIVQVGSLSS